MWAFVYSPTTPGVPVRGHFVGPGGYPQNQRKSTAEYVEIEYTAEGFEWIRRYCDRRGERRLGPDNAYGVLQECDARGLVVKNLSLDLNDRPMIDAAGNSGQLSDYDALGNVLKARSIDPESRPMPVNDGFTGNITPARKFRILAHTNPTRQRGL